MYDHPTDKGHAVIKILLATVAVSAAVTLLAMPNASAQNAAWCAHYDFGSDKSVNCGFQSFQQCLSDVRGVGGFCMENKTFRRDPRHPQR